MPTGEAGHLLTHTRARTHAGAHTRAHDCGLGVMVPQTKRWYSTVAIWVYCERIDVIGY